MNANSKSLQHLIFKTKNSSQHQMPASKTSHTEAHTLDCTTERSHKQTVCFKASAYHLKRCKAYSSTNVYERLLLCLLSPTICLFVLFRLNILNKTEYRHESITLQ